NGNGNKYADAVEIKDSPWIFIRNQAGIHAVAVDSAGARRNGSSNPKLEDIYHHFNFRTLQVKEKNTFSLQETLGIDYTKPINSFKDYVSKHFDRLLVSYTVSDSSKNNNLFRNYNLDTSSKFRNLFNEWEELVRTKARYQRSLQLREALIKEYAKAQWDVEDSSKSFKSVPKKFGISSPLPYELKLTRGGGKDEEYLFPELEKIYGVYFDGIRSKGVTYSGNLDENVFLRSIKEKQDKFQKTLISALGKLELNTKVSGYFQSDRIFLNNFYVNEIIDIFFKNENLFRNLLLKVSLKEDYLGKSFIGNKGYVDTQKTKTLLINNNSDDLDAKTIEDNFLDSLDSDSNGDNRKKLMKDIETSVNKFYYGKYFLKNIDSSLWDVLKYGGGTIDSTTNKLGESIRKASKNAFENGYFLNVDGLKDKHLKFLATLSYLTRDNFQYFLSLMRATVTPKTDAYFLWEKFNKKGNNAVTMKATSGFLKNPWLNPDVQQFSNKIHDFNGYLISYFSGYGKKTPPGQEPATQATSFYKGFLVLNSPQTWTQNLVSDPSKFVSNSLYKYGSEGSENEVDAYVQSIQNEADLEEVIEKIKEVAGKDKSSTELNLLNLKTVYITNGDSSSSSYRILTLQERKSLVSAILNNIKSEDVKDGKMDKSKYKNIFKTDPDKNWTPEAVTKHSKCTNGGGGGGGGGGCSTFIDAKKHYSPTKGGIADDYFVTQVNHNAFKDFESFKKYANKHLTKELFWAWIIDAAQNERVQEMAIRDLEDTIIKVEAYDKQFRESASYRYAK
ncbi:DUF3713 domain-containing protein, partial [Candidatus Mycoplasma haematobovis]|uniref:DUF3713 domain-containing protein n=1 Tax=Candidatus Mycoplasma haematobovis TaxID=432608 RepID=UPI000A4D5335